MMACQMIKEQHNVRILLNEIFSMILAKFWRNHHLKILITDVCSHLKHKKYFIKAISSHKLKFLIILKIIYLAILYNSVFNIFSKVLYFIMQYKENFLPRPTETLQTPSVFSPYATQILLFSVCVMGERLGS